MKRILAIALLCLCLFTPAFADYTQVTYSAVSYTSVDTIAASVNTDATYSDWLLAFNQGNTEISIMNVPFTGLTKYASNPVLTVGAGGTFDDVEAYSPSVIYDEGIYKMWYSGYTGSNYEIGYATSPDRITWTKYGSNPVLTRGGVGTWDEGNVATPTVIKDGSTYKMWYSGDTGVATTRDIGYATSSDGITWTKYVSNPVIGRGAGGTWDDDLLYYPCVIKDGSTYKMWYAGNDGTNGRIGYATSSDGISWTKDAGNPVLSHSNTVGAFDKDRVYAPCVVKVGSIYHMWFAGFNTTTVKVKLGYATSTDGISLTKYASNPVLDVGAGGTWDDEYAGWATSVIVEGSDIRMWDSGYDGSISQIGYITFANYPYGTIQTLSPDPVFNAAGNGWINYTLRIEIPASWTNAGIVSNDILKLTLQAGTAEGLKVDKVYIGHKAAAGNAWDFDGNQVQVLFSGSAVATVPSGSGGLASDNITDFTYDDTKALIISMDVSSDGSNDAPARIDPLTGWNIHYKESANEAEQTAPSGYTTAANQGYIVKSLVSIWSDITADPIFISDSEDIGTVWDMSAIDLEENPSGETGSVKYQYSCDNGTRSYNGSWLTLAQLKAESDPTGQYLAIKSQFIITSGTQDASLAAGTFTKSSGSFYNRVSYTLVQ